MKGAQPPQLPFRQDLGRSLAPKSCLGSFERGLQWSWGAVGQEPGHLLARGQAQFPSITRSKDGRTPPRHQASHSPPKAQVGLPTRLRVPHSLTRIPGIPSSAQSPSQPPKARINCRRLEPTAQGPNQLSKAQVNCPRLERGERKTPGSSRSRGLFRGDEGIRTPESRNTINSLAGSPFRPLRHVSSTDKPKA